MVTQDAAQALRKAFEHARDMDAELSEKLRSYSVAIQTFLPAYAEAVDQLVERLMITGAGQNAPRPGQFMPSFALPDESGHLVSLESLLSAGPVVVIFHRGHWCPWCRISAHTLAKAPKR